MPGLLHTYRKNQDRVNIHLSLPKMSARSVIPVFISINFFIIIYSYT